ncbi:uncharacterized protein RHOBADRAFT_41434 [Rhodotorula graminis WP1]|uniref:Uncharacterized protein n=1 Tax=Rhodotorula graminis (strain WP1) TaxID=578459 RepID=A0A194SDG6_RHOGW|nr:uncharacterized protein RHOBADRAFT_41434 [Rhodotorula graminis WP1]KPV77441.1 hypothetical protein RHOBADRAFT_41434 [Rhodotorula graminis WP1]
MDPLAHIEVKGVLSILPRTRRNGSSVFGRDNRAFGSWANQRASDLAPSWATASYDQKEYFRRHIQHIANQLLGEDTHERYEIGELLPRVETMREWLHAGAAAPSSSNPQDSSVDFRGTFPPFHGSLETGQEATPSSDRATLVHLLQSIVQSTTPSGEPLPILQWRTRAAESLAQLWETTQPARRVQFANRLQELNRRLQNGQILLPADLPSIPLMHDFLSPPQMLEPRWTGGPRAGHPWHSLAKATRAGDGRRSSSHRSTATRKNGEDETSPFWPARRSAY